MLSIFKSQNNYSNIVHNQATQIYKNTFSLNTIYTVLTKIVVVDIFFYSFVFFIFCEERNHV